MQVTFLQGYPDYVGKRFIFAVYGNGPLSYAAAGDTVILPRYNNYIDIIFPALTVSGNYLVTFKPSTYGDRAAWVALWETVGGLGSVVLTTITAAGTYTGTTPSITFAAAPAGGVTATGVGILNGAGTALIGILITNPGSGYVTAPAITVGAGGATATATLGPTVSGPVSATTNLSAEVVQFGGFGGVY